MYSDIRQECFLFYEDDKLSVDGRLNAAYYLKGRIEQAFLDDGLNWREKVALEYLIDYLFL